MKYNGFLNVGTLAVAQVFAFSVTPMLMFLGSIIGAELAPDPALATLPIAAMVVGTALGTAPMALLMNAIGRKPVFLTTALVGALGCVLIGHAVALGSFQYYCGSIFLIGLCLATVQQFRFAAMESVAPPNMPTAASMVLLGGVFAANIGPELGLQGKHLTPVAYQGSFWLAGLCFIAAFVSLCLYRQPEANTEHQQREARPLLSIASSPVFLLAVSSASIGFAIMTFVMTATPIGMHHHFEHSLEETKWVIQSHITAMFLPSLITPLVIRWLGIPGMMLAGLIAYCATVAIGFFYTSVNAFWIALVLLGIGWNFLFVGGTALLPQSYRPEEQFKVQAFNDALVFSAQAIAALSAGWIITHQGWTNVLLFCLPAMSLHLLVLLYYRRQSRHGDGGTATD